MSDVEKSIDDLLDELTMAQALVYEFVQTLPTGVSIDIYEYTTWLLNRKFTFGPLVMVKKDG